MLESWTLKPRLQNVPSEPCGGDHRWSIFCTQCLLVYFLPAAWAACAFTLSVLLLVFLAITCYLSRTDSHSSYDLLNVWDLSNARKRLNVAELTAHLGGGRQDTGEKGWRIKSCLMGFLTLFLSEHKGIPETLAAPSFFFPPPDYCSCERKSALLGWFTHFLYLWSVERQGTTCRQRASQHQLNNEVEGGLLNAANVWRLTSKTKRRLLNNRLWQASGSGC